MSWEEKAELSIWLSPMLTPLATRFNN